MATPGHSRRPYRRNATRASEAKPYESTHIPMMMRWPDSPTSLPQTDPTLVANIDIPATVTELLEIVHVTHVDEVLARAMTQPMQPIEWTEADEHAAEPPLPGHSSDGETHLRH